VLKRPNSRACALETTASFLVLPVPCIPGPMKVARGREALGTRMDRNRELNSLETTHYVQNGLKRCIRIRCICKTHVKISELKRCHIACKTFTLNFCKIIKDIQKPSADNLAHGDILLHIHDILRNEPQIRMTQILHIAKSLLGLTALWMLHLKPILGHTKVHCIWFWLT
jgi:hypothetical protein